MFYACVTRFDVAVILKQRTPPCPWCCRAWPVDSAVVAAAAMIVHGRTGTRRSFMMPRWIDRGGLRALWSRLAGQWLPNIELINASMALGGSWHGNCQVQARGGQLVLVLPPVCHVNSIPGDELTMAMQTTDDARPGRTGSHEPTSMVHATTQQMPIELRAGSVHQASNVPFLRNNASGVAKG